MPDTDLIRALGRVEGKLDGLQASVRTAVEELRQHASDDRASFREAKDRDDKLSLRLDSFTLQAGARDDAQGIDIRSLQSDRDKVKGAWWIATVFGTVMATIGGAIIAVIEYLLHGVKT